MFSTTGKKIYIYIDIYLCNVYNINIDIYLCDQGEAMEDNYNKNAVIFKVLSEPNRLRIIDMLSCGEMCACKILERFHITQPTLSHHMKTLCDSGLVNSRKEGRWMHYSLNNIALLAFKDFLSSITTTKTDYICNEGGGCEECN